MKNKFFNILITILLMSSLVLQNPISQKIVVEAKSTTTISDELQSKLNLSKIGSSDKIAVQIFLKDTLDYKKVEDVAMQTAELTREEIQGLYNSSFNRGIAVGIQTELGKKYEIYRTERIDLICAHMSKLNNEFVKDYNLAPESVALSLPEINLVYLTKDQIVKISKDLRVETIDTVELHEAENDAYSVASADQCIQTNTGRNAGYTGSGIVVGVVELGWADESLIGTKFTNVGKPNTGTEAITYDDHATFVCGEIDTVVPSAYIRLRKSSTSTMAILDAVETLMTIDKAHVINVSLGFNAGGVYSDESRRLDTLIRQNRVPVVVTAGNNRGTVSGFGLAPNAITVGAVDHGGNTTPSFDAYTFASFSDYIESSAVVNKPDVCAPGVSLDLYSLNGWNGTSMAAPLVTGAIAQMIDRNVGFANMPQLSKAALMASCYYDAGTVFINNISDEEGAGVINGDLTYRAARDASCINFDFSSNPLLFQSFSFHVGSSSKMLRIAIAWESETSGTFTNITDYDLRIYKDGQLVASSSSANNYEVVLISPMVIQDYGTGLYTAEVIRRGTINTTADTVSMVWIQ